MLELSLIELLCIAVCAVLLLSPGDMPVLIRGGVQAWRRMQRSVREIRAQFTGWVEDDVADMQDTWQEVRHAPTTPVQMIRGEDGQWHQAYALDEAMHQAQRLHAPHPLSTMTPAPATSEASASVEADAPVQTEVSDNIQRDTAENRAAGSEAAAGTKHGQGA